MRSTIILVLLLCALSSTVYAEYGLDTDNIVFVTETGFVPDSISIPENSYVKFINLKGKESVRFPFNEFVVDKYGFFDVEFKRFGVYRYFLVSNYTVKGSVAVIKEPSNRFTGGFAINYSGGGPSEYNISELKDLAKGGEKVTIPQALKDYLKRKGLLKEKQPETVPPTGTVTATTPIATQPPKATVKPSESSELPAPSLPEAKEITPAPAEVPGQANEEMPAAIPEATVPETTPETEAEKIPSAEQPEKIGGEFSEVKETSILGTVLIIALVLVTLAGIGFMAYKYREKISSLFAKKQGTLLPSQSQIPPPQLVRYLKTYKAHGYSDESLKKHLVAHGHKEQDVDSALAYVKEAR